MIKFFLLNCGGRTCLKLKIKIKKRRRGLWIALGVIAVAIFIAGFIIWQNRQAATELLAGLETEPYQRQNLDANIYGTGTVEPSQSAVLTWSTSGIISDVNVTLGQEVQNMTSS